MKIKLLIILLLLLLTYQPSQADIKIILGTNLNYIDMSRDLKFLPGLSFGNQYRIWHNNHRAAIFFDYMITIKQMEFEDRWIWFYPGIRTKYDMSLTLGYIELPLLFSYSIYSKPKKRMQLKFGPALNLALFSSVNLHHKGITDDSYQSAGNNELPDYDFSRIEDPGPQFPLIDNSAWGFQFGLAYSIHDIDLEIRYARSKLRTVGDFSIDKKYHSILFLVSF